MKHDMRNIAPMSFRRLKWLSNVGELKIIVLLTSSLLYMTRDEIEWLRMWSEGGMSNFGRWSSCLMSSVRITNLGEQY